MGNKLDNPERTHVYMHMAVSLESIDFSIKSAGIIGYPKKQLEN